MKLEIRKKEKNEKIMKENYTYKKGMKMPKQR